MAKNEILPFGIADGANVLPAEEYQKLTARNNGFSAGVARSQELNTVWRQASVIAHVVAQFIAEINNSDVLDDGNVDKLKAGLISALSKNVNNTVPAATKTVAGITKLSSATNSNDETLAATPKAVKIAYDLAKTVSIDEINKKFDKSSVLQTTGTATDKVISQKACDEFYAKKDSWEKFTAGQINIKSNGNYTSLTLIKGDGNKLLLETAPGDAYFVYRDAKNNNQAVVTIPSNKNGTLALTNNPTDITAPKLVVKSPSTHGYLELIAANGNTWRIGSNNNDQRSYFEKVGKFSIYLPEKAGTLALTSAFISNIRRGAKVQSPDTSEWGPNECPSGCVLTQVVHKGDTPYGVNNWYRPLQIFIDGTWRTLAGDE
ncbi:phage tail protein [Arsenophonus nasoniae]|uniref:Phage tail protein n=1 Tax=Arsenophonus nasoniae TaxID=638 RepID=A0AA95GPQ8_9GAMM|nr:phage tail protein [Arsenophonus nasoniae]WGM02548.1 phage tail protein [Arsenophonus nasoniae]